MNAIKSKIFLQISSDVNFLLESVESVKMSNDVGTARLLLENPCFQGSFRSFICILPSDPNVKIKSKIEYSMQVMTAAIIFAKFPAEFYLLTGQSDDNLTARLCVIASSCFLTSLSRLLRCGTCSIKEFRAGLLWYRLSVRFLFESMNRMRTEDELKVVSEISESYSQLLHVKFQLKCQSEDRSEDYDSLMQRTEERISQIKEALAQIKGKKNTDKILANIEESIEALYISSSRPSSPRSPKGAGESKTSVEQHISADLSGEQLQLLERRLESLVSEENSERLIHELSLSPTFLLPDCAGTIFLDALELHGFERCADNIVRVKDSSQDATAVTESSTVQSRIRRAMLDMLADQIICALSISDIETVSEVTVGSRLHVRGIDGMLASCLVNAIHENDRILEVTLTCSQRVILDLPYDAVKLNSEGRNSEPLLSPLIDLQERLLSFSTEIRANFASKIDFELLKQMIEKNSISAVELFDILCKAVCAILEQLIAPARCVRLTSWIQVMRDIAKISTFDEFIPFLPFFHEVTNAFSEELSRDMSNYYISTLAPSLYRNGPEIIAAKFEARLKGIEEVLLAVTKVDGFSSTDSAFSRFLPITFAQLEILKLSLCDDCGLLCKSLRSAGLSEGQLVSIRNGLRSPQSVSISSDQLHWICCSLMNELLKSPVRLTSLIVPEVYNYDVERLAGFRDELDAIILIACIGMSVKQVASRFGARAVDMNIGEEEIFFHRLDNLIHQQGVSLSMLSIESQRYLETIISRRVKRDLDAGVRVTCDGWIEELKETVRINTDASSPVMVLFTTRVFELFLRGILFDDITPQVLMQVSLGNKQEQTAFSTLIGRARSLLMHHERVHRKTYSILFRVIASGQSV